MRLSSVLALAFLSAPALAEVQPFQIVIDNENPDDVRLEVRTDPASLPFEDVVLGGREFTRVSIGEGLNLDDVGLPDLPTLHRLVAHDPERYYEVEVTAEDPLVFQDLLLAPVQQDAPDTGARLPFRMNDELYATDLEIGNETVMLGDAGVLAGVPVLPLKITPIHYNPAQRRLTVWQKVTARIHATGEKRARRPYSLTSFQASQIRNLVENYGRVLNGARIADDHVLIVTTPELEASARTLANVIAQPSGTWSAVIPEVRVVQRGLPSTSIKDVINARFAQGGLDSVVLFGDESQLPLHQWTTSLPGDSFYQFLAGGDWYADVALGRLPVSDAAEAAIIIDKLRTHRAQQAAGWVNKNVLLVAHKELYPDKYTANMERVRAAANPRRLVFSTAYGGAGAMNGGVVDYVSAGQAIVNYRGHGSGTTWSGWASDSSSFGQADVAAFANAGRGLSVFFNVACSNGAIQDASHSLAERLLFHTTPAGEGAGAVGVLAATILSATQTNHKYNEHLFQYLQTDENLRLGNVNALANNRLVRDNGGSIPNNVKMYLLLADPTLTPAITPQTASHIGASPSR